MYHVNYFYKINRLSLENHTNESYLELFVGYKRYMKSMLTRCSILLYSFDKSKKQQALQLLL